MTKRSQESFEGLDLKAQFYELSLDLLCLLDTQGRIKDANPALLTALGKASHELIEMPLLDLVWMEDSSEVISALQELEHSHFPVSFTCRFRCFDNTLRWYLWTVYPRAQEIFHAVGKDITPYKEIEAKEVERNVFAEALLDTVLAINNSLALDQVLERILSNIGKVVAYEYVSILLVVGEKAGAKAQVVGVQNGIKHNHHLDQRKAIQFLIGDDEHLSTMFNTHKSVIVPELKQLPAWILGSASINGEGAFLGSPIIVDDTVIGFLCVFNSKKDFFTPLHAQQLITFANQAGIAIHNARLYEQAQSAAILRERQRMAQELHDAVNQDLFAASAFADLLPRAIAQKPNAVAQYATRISELIRRAVDQMRMILIELHPDRLITTGLDTLLQQLCDVFSRQTGVPVHFNANTRIILDEQAQIAVYRIAQEALHNINRHARATRVNVTLCHSSPYLTLIIQDNGCGFDQDAIMEIQFGVSGMRERAKNINADLQIKSKSGFGTRIRLRKELMS